MRIAGVIGMVVVLAACGGQTAQLGGTAGDGGQGNGDASSTSGEGGTTGTPTSCHGSPVIRPANAAPGTPAACAVTVVETGGGDDGGSTDDGSADATPTMTTTSTGCSDSEVCFYLPGSHAGQCEPACQSDCDCPAWLSCQNGTCAQCGGDTYTCPAGTSCSWATSPEPAPCSADSECANAGYCQDGMCEPYFRCVACVGDCPKCTSNAQCGAGEVCDGETCNACSSDSQCGPQAKCTATHTGFQCTCSGDADCASGACASGVCEAPSPTTASCNAGASCPKGQGCVNGVCGACSTFEDCNPTSRGAFGPLSGFACVNGTCAACTTNSQCGGGQACVGGTCGTCATNSQCGPTGTCTDGFCTCSADSQCASGQRCGQGVCVEK
jgi:Cys-rich repeat protein